MLQFFKRLGFQRLKKLPIEEGAKLKPQNHSFVNKYLVHSIYEIKIVKGIEIFKMPLPISCLQRIKMCIPQFLF